MGIHINIIVATTHKDSSHIYWMIIPSVRVGSKVSHIFLQNFLDVVKTIRHGPLESCPIIFIQNGSSWCALPKGEIKNHFMLIFWFNLDLIIAGEIIHEGQYLIIGAFIDYLNNGRDWEIIFWTHMVQISIINTENNGTMFFWWQEQRWKRIL